MREKLTKQYKLAYDRDGFFHKIGYGIEEVLSLPDFVLSAIMEAYMYVNCILLIKNKQHSCEYIFGNNKDSYVEKGFYDAYYMFKNTRWYLESSPVNSEFVDNIEEYSFQVIKEISNKKILKLQRNRLVENGMKN